MAPPTSAVIKVIVENVVTCFFFGGGTQCICYLISGLWEKSLYRCKLLSR